MGTTTISKGKDYDNVSEGEFRALPAGGYICRVVQAKVQKNKSGKDMLVVLLDVSEGDFKDYFWDLWNNRKTRSDNPQEVKYPNDGIAYINTEDNEGNTNRRFKSFCTSIEESGGFVWDESDNLMVEELKDAVLGVIFRREQHEYNGKMYWNTKPYGFRSVDTIKEGRYTVPDDLYAETSNFDDFDPGDKFAQAEDDIPFK